MNEITINEKIDFYIRHFFDFLEKRKKTKMAEYLRNHNNFDEKYYKNRYPDLKNYPNLYEHYLYYGLIEGRLCSLEHENMCNEFNNLYLKKIIENNKFMKPTKYENHFNILIRTSNRKDEFKRCLKSIYDQSYCNVKLIISYDDNNTLKYINDENITLNHILVEINQKNKNKNSYFYNSYCNKLLKHVNDGWILFLDDDDEMIAPNTLHIINNFINGKQIEKDALIIFYNYRNDKIIKVIDKNNPCPGELAISSCIFHSKYKDLALFTNKNSGDFDFFKNLFFKLKPIYFDYPIVKINHYI